MPCFQSTLELRQCVRCIFNSLLMHGIRNFSAFLFTFRFGCLKRFIIVRIGAEVCIDTEIDTMVDAFVNLDIGIDTKGQFRNVFRFDSQSPQRKCLFRESLDVIFVTLRQCRLFDIG